MRWWGLQWSDPQVRPDSGQHQRQPVDTMAVSNTRNFTDPLMAGRLVFLAAAILSGLLVWQLDQKARHYERDHVARLAGDHALEVERSLQQTMTAAYVLAALVRQGNGSVPQFEAIAGAILPHFPGVSHLTLAPGGVVRSVAPASGNERAIDLNLLNDPAQRGESLLARDNGRLTLTGPLELVQGGTAVIGRLPVFLDGSEGTPFFWGFVMVVIRLPESLNFEHMSGLSEQGLAYELWRIRPDNGQKQVIAHASSAPLIEPVEHALRLPNAIWTLSIAPAQGWGRPLALTFQGLLGLLVSLLLGYVARLVVQLETNERLLEARIARRTSELFKTQRKLKATLDALPDPVWLKDAGGVYLSCNPGCESIFGASEAEIIGKSDYDFIGREQADLFRESDRTAMTADKPTINEEWLTSATDGKRRRFETIKTPMFDEDGNIIGVLGIAHDITQRTLAEHALLQSQQQTQQYLAIVGVMLVALDAEGRVQLVNRKGCEMLGAPEAEIL
ncbi:MAG: PAS domain-containing protein, partial [Thiobacillus sp.]